MLRLLLAALMAASITGCAGAGDERPAPTVMGEETAPGATTAPRSPGGYP